MKKIFKLLGIVLVGNILINSCIYDKVCEGEASIIIPSNPDTTIVNPPSGGDATKKTFYLRFLPDEMDSISINTYAGASFNSTGPTLAWGTTESVGAFIVGSNGSYLYENRKYNFTPSVSLIYTDTITTSYTTATVYGYTPYQSSTSGTIVSYTLNSVQDQSADKSKENSMDEVLAGNVFTISNPSSFNLNGNTCNMPFKSIFSFLRIQVTRASSFPTFSLQKIKNVKLYIADENTPEVPKSNAEYPLTGYYNIDVTKAPGTSGYTGPIFNSGTNSITAAVVGGNSITEYTSTSPYVWFVINPVTLKSTDRLVSIIETTLNGTDVQYTIKTQHQLPTLRANTIYTLNIEANSSNAYSDRNIPNYFSDISNCYIVSQAGMCQMPVRASLTTVNSVDWIWASKEGGSSSFDISELIDPSTIVYDPIAHCVRFRVGSSFGKFTKGNVILALKDASGNIVWTWHIWLTDKPEDIAYDSFVFMDRNIGALSTDINNSPAVDTYGFVYQWGRKDPFFGGDGVIYDEATSILETARMHTIVNTSYTWNYVEKAIGGDLDYSIKHPMSFIYNEGSGLSWRNDPADWLSTSNSSLWSATSKTDYDPCPNGYRVPAANDVNILHFANVTTPKTFDKDSEKYWKYNSSSVSYWPAAGMRQGRQNLSSDNLYGAQLKYSGTNMIEGQCYYWTSTPSSVGGTPLLGASYRIHTVSNLLYSVDDYGDNADAYPIRCVKE